MIGCLSPEEILYQGFVLLITLPITLLMAINFFPKSSALLVSFLFETISRMNLSRETLTESWSLGLRRRFDVRYCLTMVLISSPVRSSSGLILIPGQELQLYRFGGTYSLPTRWKKGALTGPGFRRRVTCSTRRCILAFSVSWACASSCFSLYTSTSLMVTWRTCAWTLG